MKGTEAAIRTAGGWIGKSAGGMLDGTMRLRAAPGSLALVSADVKVDGGRIELREEPPFTARYPAEQRKSAIIAALYLAQGQQGYITRNAMRAVAAAIRCTTAQVEDIVYFYTMFYTRPMGKHIVMVCRTLSCALAGAERVTEALSQELGLKPGETDANREFSLLEVECLGACDRAPVVGVNDDWHEGLTPEQCAQFIDDVRAVIAQLEEHGARGVPIPENLAKALPAICAKLMSSQSERIVAAGAKLVLAALKHQVVDRDGVLGRMLPFLK